MYICLYLIYLKKCLIEQTTLNERREKFTLPDSSIQFSEISIFKVRYSPNVFYVS